MKTTISIFVTLLLSVAAFAQQPSVSIAVAAPGQRSVTLNWTDSGTGITAYKVYRGTAPSGENYNAPIGTTLGTVTQYQDTTVVSGTTYYYTVTALSTVESSPSNERSE